MDIETLTDHIEAIRGTLKIAVADTKAQGLTRTWAKEALPHLEAIAAHLSTSNGMTEEEIERISDEQETIAQMAFDPEDITAYTVGFKSGLRYARDRGMLAPSNVPVVTHLNMDPNASTETKEAVRDMIQAAYSYKPQREHAWEARGMNGHWWCLNCGICGGNSTAPANIGPCVDKGPANTCASPPLKEE